MSGLGIVVLTLLLLVSMATSHQDRGEKQAMQRDAINVIRRSVIRRQVTEACEEACEAVKMHCCDVSDGTTKCVTRCLG
uniref:Conotoxin superfamily O3 n=1 Tax=Conus magus TaxID=6492 RepID=A0A5P8I0T2_CONMA|nr:conotoxin superfamily O3 [Conus magus]